MTIKGDVDLVHGDCCVATGGHAVEVGLLETYTQRVAPAVDSHLFHDNPSDPR